MRRTWVALSRFCIALIASFLLLYLGWIPVSMAESPVPLEQYKSKPQNITVILEREYLDGVVGQEVVHETCWSMENFWAKYDQWHLTHIDHATFVFRKQVDDISPLLKTDGYFGMTENGVLTIFNGRPDRSRIIQSFFQLDIKKLESKKQEELIQGIPIKTKDHYVEVLETLKQYSKE